MAREISSYTPTEATTNIPRPRGNSLDVTPAESLPTVAKGLDRRGVVYTTAPELAGKIQSLSARRRTPAEAHTIPYRSAPKER